MRAAVPWVQSAHDSAMLLFCVQSAWVYLCVNCVIYWPAVCSRMQINAVAFFREAISQFKARDLWRKTWAPAQSCRSSSWLFGSTQPTQPASCPRLPIPLSKPSIAAQMHELNRCTADVESDQLPPGGCQPALCAVVQFTRAPRRVFGGFNCFCLFWRCFSKIAYVFRGSMRECCRIVKLVFLGRVRVSWCQKFRVMRELSNQRYCAFFPRGFRIEMFCKKKKKNLRSTKNRSSVKSSVALTGGIFATRGQLRSEWIAICSHLISSVRPTDVAFVVVYFTAPPLTAEMHEERAMKQPALYIRFGKRLKAREQKLST